MIFGTRVMNESGKLRLIDTGLTLAGRKGCELVQFIPRWIWSMSGGLVSRNGMPSL